MHQKQLINRCWMVPPVLQIRIGFNADPDPPILVTADLDPYPYPDTRFWWPKLERFYCRKIAISLVLDLDDQATGEVFIPQKRTSSTSKLVISSLLWVSFCNSGSGSSRPKWLRIRIRIHNTEYNGCQAGAAWFNEILTASHMLILSAAGVTVL